MEEFGELTAVDLRKYWKSEAQDFTPWLSQKKNLDRLAKTLKMELEFEGKEVPVGPYKADIVAIETSRNAKVVIENQLGKTDHDHLGKVLTYASGLDAKILIWIALEFTEEHRRALDFLNETVSPNLQLFGIEIQLLKIGDSLPAPQFKIVSSPNEYTNSVKVEKELTETESLYLKYWSNLRDYLKSQESFLPLTKAYPQHYYGMSVGRSNCMLALTFSKMKQRMGCEMYLSGSEAGKLFHALKDRQEEIETAIGPIEWQELPDKQDCRIVEYKPDVDITAEDEWGPFFEWMKERAESFHKVFSPLLKNIQLPEDDEDEGI